MIIVFHNPWNFFCSWCEWVVLFSKTQMKLNHHVVTCCSCKQTTFQKDVKKRWKTFEDLLLNLTNTNFVHSIQIILIHFKGLSHKSLSNLANWLVRYYIKILHKEHNWFFLTEYFDHVILNIYTKYKWANNFEISIKKNVLISTSWLSKQNEDWKGIRTAD